MAVGGLNLELSIKIESSRKAEVFDRKQWSMISDYPFGSNPGISMSESIFIKDSFYIVGGISGKGHLDYSVVQKLSR